MTTCWRVISRSTATGGRDTRSPRRSGRGPRRCRRPGCWTDRSPQSRTTAVRPMTPSKRAFAGMRWRSRRKSSPRGCRTGLDRFPAQEGVEVRGEGVATGITPLGSFSRHSGRSSRGRAGAWGVNAGGDRFLVHHLEQRAVNRRSAKRRPTGEQLVEGGPQGIEVAGRPRARSLSLFRGHVGGGPNDSAGAQRPASWPLMILARPKSVILGWPSSVRRMLAGFRSRWTIPCACATPMARARVSTSWAAWRHGNGPLVSCPQGCRRWHAPSGNRGDRRARRSRRSERSGVRSRATAWASVRNRASSFGSVHATAWSLLRATTRSSAVWRAPVDDAHRPFTELLEDFQALHGRRRPGRRESGPSGRRAGSPSGERRTGPGLEPLGNFELAWISSSPSSGKRERHPAMSRGPPATRRRCGAH